MQANLRIFREHIWDNYKYTVSQRRGNLTYYVCTYSKSGICGGRGVLKNEIFTVTKGHTHQPNITQLKEDAFKRDLFRSILNNPYNTFKKIYDDVRLHHQDAATTVTFARIENSMFKWRQKLLPPPVFSLFSYVQTINSNDWGHLKNYRSGTMNIVFEVAEDLSHSVLLMDPNFVRKIAVTGYFYLDATFKVVPRSVGAQQFLTVMSRKYNTVIPCIWVLMERKTTAAYRSVFRAIKRQIPDFQIMEAMIDYEKPLRKALKQVFLGIIVYGCLFHYKQALFKHALKLGLKRILNQNADARHLLALLMSLPLLPANVIRITYQEILHSTSLYLRQTFRSFFRYYEKEWLSVVRPETFSVYMQTNRTNNCVEAYHKTLKAKCGVHSTMWTFSGNIINLQENSDVELQSLERGLIVRRLPKKITTMKQNLLSNAWNIFNQPNGFTAMQFLEHVISFQTNTVEAYSVLYDN